MKRLAALFCAGLALAWAQCAGATITDTNLGNAGSSSSAATLTITTTAACAVATGNYIQVAIVDGTNVGVTSVADTGLNTYTIDTTAYTNPAGANNTIRLARAPVTGTDTLGSSIVVTYTGTSVRPIVTADCITGLVSSSPPDIAPSKTVGTTATPSNGPTATLAQSNEIGFGVLMTNQNQAVTEDTTHGTWVTKMDNQSCCGPLGLHVGSQIVSSTTAMTYAPTLAGVETGDGWVDVIFTLKGAASGVVATSMMLVP